MTVRIPFLKFSRILACPTKTNGHVASTTVSPRLFEEINTSVNPEDPTASTPVSTDSNGEPMATTPGSTDAGEEEGDGFFVKALKFVLKLVLYILVAAVILIVIFIAVLFIMREVKRRKKRKARQARMQQRYHD